MPIHTGAYWRKNVHKSRMNLFEYKWTIHNHHLDFIPLRLFLISLGHQSFHKMRNGYGPFSFPAGQHYFQIFTSLIHRYGLSSMLYDLAYKSVIGEIARRVELSGSQQYDLANICPSHNTGQFPLPDNRLLFGRTKLMAEHR